jgi:hypothetical protein
VTIAVAFLLTRGVAQAVTPFIRQDDWTFLLPDHSPGAVPPSYYNISEGRWLNTGWWWLVGQHGTPTTAALTYAVGYALFVAGAWRVLHLSGVRPRPVVDVLLGLALFASVVWVQLLYWPGALTPSVIVGAASVWLLPGAATSRLRLGLWLVLSEVAAVLTYPPIGVILLVLAVVLLRAAAWHRVLAVACAWVGSFALGIAVAYTLNWVVNQHFGLELAAWRKPNPLTSLDAFGENTRRWLDAAGALWSAQWWVALVGLVAGVVGWRDARIRPRLQRLLIPFAVASGIDAAQTLATGTVTEARGQLWTWLVAVLPVALLLAGRDRPGRDRPRGEGPRGDRARDDRPDRRVRRVPRVRPLELVATVLLAFLAVAGVLAWRGDIGAHQATRQQYAAIAERATHHEPGAVAPTVVVYQDPDVKDSRDGRLMASTMFMAVRQDQGGLLPRWCSGPECADLVGYPPGSVVRLVDDFGQPTDVVGVVVPTPPGWL